MDLKLNVAIAKEAVVMYIEQRKQLHAALGALRKLPQTGTTLGALRKLPQTGTENVVRGVYEYPPMDAPIIRL